MAIRKTRAQLDAQMNQVDQAGQEEPEERADQNEKAVLPEEQAQPESDDEQTTPPADKTETESPLQTACAPCVNDEETASSADNNHPESSTETVESEPAANNAAEERPTATSETKPPADECQTECGSLACEDVAETIAEPKPNQEVITEERLEQSESEEQSESLETEDAPNPQQSLDTLLPAQRKQVKQLIESLLFASSAPLPVKKLSEIVSDFAPELSTRTLRALIEELRDELREAGRGIRVLEVAGSYQLRTPSEAAPFVRKLVSVRPPRLTRATLETLAIVAYRQPVTRPEIEDIRGVDCGAVLKHLLDKKLVKIMGRKEEVGRPLLYATTQDFLEFFSLKDLRSLPTLKDFVELSDEHRAQLGIEANEKQEQKQERAEFTFAVEETDSYSPVGQDEVIEELSEALASIGKKNRDLRKSGILEDEEEQAAEETECTQTDSATPDSTDARDAQNDKADSAARQPDEG